ncbi:hypothetical protein [Micromonospora cathayae]|uniref:Centromere-binding protein ParB C-terminal domain-containing protein n=1 Tax=Micromonospora cathayae TaxID=3028804 RepID=A0ABY7ZW25_9ACTN|nr:hypothetical protein [Micromonospora sp. HUAS 3]WDZ87190.1 hypothetical protein PVK37_12680 [Micromonospora sp. HUAS 3]
MKTHKVTAPYITLRVNDGLGQEVLRGFHQGATVPEGVNQEDLDRHVRKGMVAEEGSREANLLAVPAGTPVQEPADEGRRTRRTSQRTGDEPKG